MGISMIGDIDSVIDRFKTLQQYQKDGQYELVSTKFNEYELKEIIYLLGELKYRREMEQL